MKLETSQDLLERLRARHTWSWYRLAKELHAHENTVRNWRHGRTIVDRRFAPRIAELLGESAEYVLVCLEADRERDTEVLKVWERMAAKFRSHAASVLLVGLALLGVGNATPAEAFDGHGQGDVRGYVYYVSSRRRRWWTWFPLPVPA